MWQQGPTYFCPIPKYITSRYKQSITWQRIYLPTSWYPFGFHQRKDLATTITQNKENYAQKKRVLFSVTEKKTFWEVFSFEGPADDWGLMLLSTTKKTIKMMKTTTMRTKVRTSPWQQKDAFLELPKVQEELFLVQASLKTMSRHSSIRTSL